MQAFIVKAKGADINDFDVLAHYTSDSTPRVGEHVIIDGGKPMKVKAIIHRVPSKPNRSTVMGRPPYDGIYVYV